MRRRLIVLAGIVLLAASCGDDDDSGAGGSTTPPASEAPSESGAPTSPASEAPAGSAPVSLQGQVNNEGTAEIGDEVELELDDYYFGPTFMKATPGATVTLELGNEGDDSHTFTIDALDVDQEVAAGDTAEVEVTLPEEGTVMFYCRFHRDRGMQGAFYFDGGTVTTGTGG